MAKSSKAVPVIDTSLYLKAPTPEWENGPVKSFTLIPAFPGYSLSFCLLTLESQFPESRSPLELSAVSLLPRTGLPCGRHSMLFESVKKALHPIILAFLARTCALPETPAPRIAPGLSREKWLSHLDHWSPEFSWHEALPPSRA